MALNEEALQELKTELLEELVKEEPNKAQLTERLAEIRSADIGEVLEELIEEDEELSAALTVLDILSTERAANVLGYLPKESQLEVVGELSDSQVLKLLEEMGSDERADLFNRLGKTVAKRCCVVWRTRSARISSAWRAMKRALPAPS